jgi:hypothetical protein
VTFGPATEENVARAPRSSMPARSLLQHDADRRPAKSAAALAGASGSPWSRPWRLAGSRAAGRECGYSDLVHLEVLAAVARHGSVTEAAKELHYSVVVDAADAAEHAARRHLLSVIDALESA